MSDPVATAVGSPVASVQAAETVLASMETILPTYLEVYRDLHAHPELSFHETRTAGVVAARLRQLGYHTTESVGTTGVVGVLRNGDGAVVLARSDMDALPLTEQTGLPYASTVSAETGSGNDVGVMHACGHDMNTASLLGTAHLLASNRDAWSGTFVAVFQPAEEIGRGARAMVEDGLAAQIPMPDVALAQHVARLPYDCVASLPGPALSAADSIRVTLHGRSCHGSAPHEGIDPILLGSAIVLRLNAVVSREIKPGHFAVVTVGSFRSGNKSNVIPETAELLLNTRAYDERTRNQLHQAIERVVRAECEASGAPLPPEFDYYETFGVTVNSAEVHRNVSAAFAEYFGDRSMPRERSTGSEDFAEIPNALGIPYFYWNFGCIDPDIYRQAETDGALTTALPSNHSATFAPVAGPTLRTGIRAMTVALMRYLATTT